MTTFPLTIVVPVHQLASADEKVLLANAIRSIGTQEHLVPEAVILVGPANLEEELKGYLLMSIDTKFSVVVNEGETDIASQINAGIAAATTEYVTILELDDELGNQYVSEMAKHAAALPEVDVLLPLVASITVDGKLIKYSNEAVWVPKNEEERPTGYVDAETTQASPDLFLSGALVKRVVYQAVNGLKTNIEVAFINEFFRRLVFQGYVVRGIGKLLYAHRERREGSYIYEKMIGPGHLTEDELQFWLEAAAREFRFETQRPIRLTTRTSGAK